jgi:Fe2+ or Zn2+ uptake regulation protein
MKLSELLEQVKQAGGRITKTRSAILDYLLSVASPVSPAEILAYLTRQELAANRTTVYRELVFLTDHNIIREVRLLGRPSLFELAGRHCHHLICTRCHRVETIEMANHLDQEERQIMKQEKFQVTGHSLEFYGLCRHCRQAV